jgi:PKD repeat protein
MRRYTILLAVVVGSLLAAGASGSSALVPPAHPGAPVGTASLLAVDRTLATPPSVQASEKPNPADVGSPLNFYGLVSGLTSYTVDWNFGDGTHSSAQYPVHTYSQPANYTVVLTVTSGTYSGSSTIYVLINPVVQATFSLSPQSPSAGASVTFTATPTLGTPPYVGFWSFGDGTTGTGLTVSHSFASAGRYTVRLWANDSGEGSASQSLTVTVGPSTGGSQPTGSTNILIGTTIAAVAVALAGFGYLQWEKKRRPARPEPRAAPRRRPRP